MFVPRRNKKCPGVTKICKFCGKEFIGHYKSKYCDEHNTRKLRHEKVKVQNEGFESTRLIQHNCIDFVQIQYNCDAPGCQQIIHATLLPNVNVYPKYCKEHRTKHRLKMAGVIV